MYPRKSQTSTATPAKPGELLSLFSQAELALQGTPRWELAAMGADLSFPSARRGPALAPAGVMITLKITIATKRKCHPEVHRDHVKDVRHLRGEAI